jgi:hypothetical protein
MEVIGVGRDDGAYNFSALLGSLFITSTLLELYYKLCTNRVTE